VTDTVVTVTDLDGRTQAIRSGDDDVVLTSLVAIIVRFMGQRGWSKFTVAQKEVSVEDQLNTDALLYGTACYTYNAVTGKKTRIDPTKVVIRD
jgi:hypothetical protein